MRIQEENLEVDDDKEKWRRNFRVYDDEDK
jgi:hypothetical protein